MSDTIRVAIKILKHLTFQQNKNKGKTWSNDKVEEEEKQKTDVIQHNQEKNRERKIVKIAERNE